MAYTVFKKDPSSILDYAFDWSDWLASGETIASVSWTVPAGISAEDYDETETLTTVWLSGGTADTDYNIACKITTSAGRVDERTMTIKVRQR